MPRVDETSCGAHGFTVDWWRELPEAFRVADRVQGETLAPAWDGLNRDPRFVTGFDGWDRANTSTLPWVVSFTMTRTFKVTPNVPVLVRSWHTPYLVGTTTVSSVDVRHTIRDYTDATVASTTGRVTTKLGTHETWVTPDRFGQLTVAVNVTLNMGQTSTNPVAKDTMDVLAAIHVGTRDVAFDELPDLASFTINKPYPLLRFMDGVGHQAGFLDDQLAHMWDGGTFNPVTAPEQWLRFLGTIMGLPRTYMGRLTLPQLRSHLVAFAENGRPPIGSRRNIAEVAKQWLTGDKQVSVIPATQLPTWSGGEDKQLLQAVKGSTTSGKVIVSPTAPVPATEYQWTGAPFQSTSVRLDNGVMVAENLETNPSFGGGSTGWLTNTRATLAHDTTTWNTGGGALRVTPNSDATDDWYLMSDYRRTEATSTFTTTLWAMSKTRVTMVPRIYGYNGGGGTSGQAVTLEPNTWTPLTVNYTMATGYQYRIVVTPTKGTTTKEPIWVDRVYTARTEYDNGTYFNGSTTDSSSSDVWVKPGSPNTIYVWDQQARWVQKTGVTQGLIDAVVDARRGVRSVYTLLMFVRADELPNRDLKAFQQFMQDSGVIPAGHRLVCLESRPTWDQWETAVGPTWTDLESRTKTWTDSESAGVTLDF